MRVSSSTQNVARGRRPGRLRAALRPSLVIGIVLCLSLGLGGPAQAENLNDARDRVRRELSQTNKDIASDKKVLAEAKARLADSQAELVEAQHALATATAKLDQAKADDARIAQELAEADSAAQAAQAAERQAQAEVDEQRRVVANAVRTAYQQQTPLVGVTVFVGADTPTELAQRMQWTDTIFGSVQAQYVRLRAAEATLQRLSATAQAAQAKSAERKQASAAALAKVQQLTEEAAGYRATVTALVEKNKQARAAAENELEQSTAQYEKLQREEAAIAAKLAKDNYNLVNKGGFIRPVNAPAGSPFGMRFHPILHYWRMHWGTDFGAACGAPIRAMANGKVISAGWTTTGFGNYTIISYGKRNGAQLASGYAHQSKVIVKAGQYVAQGQIVGYVGTTGLSTGCHLHLQIYRNGERVNPMKYL
ncbi:murein DD-endopeptidase MepM/ murein hydrolase activator NlpD [Propionicimonas paludicola]|uniref:Murein DD-endopeptidase MepM/ murein hydrolase activator NlpD n=1 Tax=Propionicimonas paludicola TaxID=185243 RepID=A0A2A9CPG7_9ACTN|nr:M23 family metallopeptidase [Propionicimonas paludicola]PFG16347.1 murein DD-endopeptidase MepM/ murein hydrolase activator NlpD [Propionicimonas paludicola]